MSIKVGCKKNSGKIVHNQRAVRKMQCSSNHNLPMDLSSEAEGLKYFYLSLNINHNPATVKSCRIFSFVVFPDYTAYNNCCTNMNTM